MDHKYIEQVIAANLKTSEINEMLRILLKYGLELSRDSYEQVEHDQLLNP